MTSPTADGETTLPVPTGDDLRAGRGDAWLPVALRYRPDPAWNPVADGELVARHVYTDAGGAPLWEVLRFRTRAGHPAHPNKQFLSRRRAESGEWRWGLDGVTLVPYRLPAVAAAVARGETVFVVEGERDVEELEAAGLTATCNPLGALQWTAAHSAWLRGADVVVLPDNDRAGVVHAARVVASLRGVARSVRLLLLPGLGAGGDVSDWLAGGGTASDLLRLAAQAPADPTDRWLAERFRLPSDADLLSTSAEAVRALLLGNAPQQPASAAFARTLAVLGRLGIPVPQPAQPPANPAAADFAAWRSIRTAIAGAATDLRARLEDAFALERARFELAVFAPVMLGGAWTAPPDAAGDADAPIGFAAGVRLVTEAWDWDAWLANPSSSPAVSATTYALVPAPQGIHTHRLQPLPALVARLCAEPRSIDRITDEVARALDGDPPREAVVNLVRRQTAQMQTAGILRPHDDQAPLADEMRAWLLADEPPASAPRAAALVARSAASALEQLAALSSAEPENADALYGAHRADVGVMLFEAALGETGLTRPFAPELAGRWGAADGSERALAIRPLLDAASSLRQAGPPQPFVMQ